MRLALLSDAHGNSVGLAACLRRIAEMEVDAIYFLGDAVGYLSAPAAVLELLEAAGASCLKGNHEAMLLGELPLEPERDRYYRLTAQRDELDAAAIARLAAWPEHRELEVDGARILLAHGSPAPSIVERIHEDTPWAPGPDFPYEAAFIGHTHRAFIRREGGVWLVNVGSCGLPRDRGDLAAFAIYDGQTGEPRIHRVRFDVERALRLHGREIAAKVRQAFHRKGPFHGDVL
jgi:predicted phosphodiesterase